MSPLVTAAPALPLHAAGKYVAGTYIVFLVYVGIMATRLSRTERELVQLRHDVEQREDSAEQDPEAVHQ